MNHDNSVISLCGQVAISGSSSSACNNINLICHKFHINKYALQGININNCIKMYLNKLVGTDSHAKAATISDLLYLRDSFLSKFSRGEINELLEVVCTE